MFEKLQFTDETKLETHLKTPRAVLSGFVENGLWIFCLCIAHRTFIQMWQWLYSQFLLPFITRFPGKTFKRAKQNFCILVCILRDTAFHQVL